MDISIEKPNDRAVVATSGRLDAAGAPALEAQCRTLIQEGAKRLLLDMAQVEYISSAGLRSLLVLAKAMNSSGGASASRSATQRASEPAARVSKL